MQRQGTQGAKLIDGGVKMGSGKCGRGVLVCRLTERSADVMQVILWCEKTTLRPVQMSGQSITYIPTPVACKTGCVYVKSMWKMLHTTKRRSWL